MFPMVLPYQPFPWQVKGEDKVMAPEEVSSMVLTKMKANLMRWGKNNGMVVLRRAPNEKIQNEDKIIHTNMYV